jgi:hypothetical protein
MNEALDALRNLQQKETPSPPLRVIKEINSEKRNFIKDIERKMPDKTQAFFDYDINGFKCASLYFETLSLQDKNWADNWIIGLIKVSKSNRFSLENFGYCYAIYEIDNAIQEGKKADNKKSKKVIFNEWATEAGWKFGILPTHELHSLARKHKSNEIRMKKHLNSFGYKSIDEFNEQCGDSCRKMHQILGIQYNYITSGSPKLKPVK